MCFGGSVSAGSARVSLASLASGNPGRRVSFYRSDDRVRHKMLLLSQSTLNALASTLEQNDMDGMNDLMRELLL